MTDQETAAQIRSAVADLEAKILAQTATMTETPADPGKDTPAAPAAAAPTEAKETEPEEPAGPAAPTLLSPNDKIRDYMAAHNVYDPWDPRIYAPSKPEEEAHE